MIAVFIISAFAIAGIQIGSIIILCNAAEINKDITVMCTYLICSTVIILVIIITGTIILTNCEKNKSKNEKEKIDAIKVISVITRLNAYKATNNSLARIEKGINALNGKTNNILKEIEKK